MVKVPKEITVAAVGMLQTYIPGLSPEKLIECLRGSESAPTSPKPEKPLTRKETANLLSVSLSTVNRYIKSGQLTPVHVGPRLVRITPASIHALLNQ